jgi:hypothetical protein
MWKMNKISSGMTVAALAGIAVLMPTSAYAYLDPGSGAFAVQALLAAIAGGLIAIRAYGKRVMGFFRRPKSSPDVATNRSIPDRDA